jgi:shikimate dehydrogenase
VSPRSAKQINASTRFCAVFGHPIAHSASPAIQNAGLAALGLNWRYLAFDVHPDNLAAAINGARDMGFIGLNLTVPHKILALPLVDAIDPEAKKWGAVNTIVFEARDASGQWAPVGQGTPPENASLRSHGYNTDADAIIQALRDEFSWPNAGPQTGLSGATVLLLGAGGAATAAALRLAQEGITQLWLVNRTESKRRELKEAVLREFPKLDVRENYPSGPVDLVINATSLGLKSDDPLPIDLDWLQSKKPSRVFDMIYRPRETPLLRAARAAGCQTANGMGMLLHQGARALELWTGCPAPVVAMRSALEANIYV